MSAPEPSPGLTRRNLYRLAIIVSLPTLPFWLFVAMILNGFPGFVGEYWQELRAAYRSAPAALRKGARL